MSSDIRWPGVNRAWVQTKWEKPEINRSIEVSMDVQIQPKSIVAKTKFMVARISAR